MKEKFLLFLTLIVFTDSVCSKNNDFETKQYECLTETRVSGLFQFERKFLKETDFFPDKTKLVFSRNYSLLVEKENIEGQKFETKYQ